MTQPHSESGRRGHWTAADVPDQSGRVIVVTGANAGIGLEISEVLARRGAHVVLACRDLDRAKAAADRIAAAGRAARGSARSAADRPAAPSVVRLDLSSLSSVRTAADEICARFPRVDVLINNAAVMEVPYERTADGFELTLATNHLGPFALTGLLLERLASTPGSRVVTMSSQGHTGGVIRFDDLQSEDSYDPPGAYFQSKLANLLFTYELDRRLRAAGARTSALAAHPGVVYTALFRHRPRLEQVLLSRWGRPVNFRAVQNVHRGALPMLRAATDPAARGGEFYGPHRRHDTGYPVIVQSSPSSYDADDQARLWEVSERLTGVSYTFGTEPALP